jgi:hypothetical protein
MRLGNVRKQSREIGIWKKMIAAAQEEVWPHVKPSDPKMEQYKHDDAYREKGLVSCPTGG